MKEATKVNLPKTKTTKIKDKKPADYRWVKTLKKTLGLEQLNILIYYSLFFEKG